MQSIGNDYGLSRERIRQVVRKMSKIIGLTTEEIGNQISDYKKRKLDELKITTFNSWINKYGRLPIKTDEKIINPKLIDIWEETISKNLAERILIYDEFSIPINKEEFDYHYEFLCTSSEIPGGNYWKNFSHLKEFILRHAQVLGAPNLMPKHKVLSVDNYPQVLYRQLKTLVSKQNPVIVLLTPGLYNSAYYEHATLARLMGVELVEGSDLVLYDHEVFMKTASGLKKIDVIYRRIDDDFLDPLSFNTQSVLGLAGIMESFRQGKVCIVNSPGTGIADDKAIYSYVPKMIKYYLNENPILHNIETFQMGNKGERKYVQDNVENMVIKKTDGSGGYDMLMGNKASEIEKDKYLKKVKKNPHNYIAQPILNLSTAPCIINGKLAPRCLDLRPFAIFGANKIEVCPGGLTRVAMEEGSLVVNSSQGGGSKDTWIIKK